MANMQRKNAVRTSRKNRCEELAHILEKREGQVKASKEPNKQEKLTIWRVQTKEQIKIAEKTKRATNTHSLKITDGGTVQNGKKKTERATGTHFLERQTKEQVRMAKETERATGTH